MKTIQEIKTDIDTLVRKQGNQGALKLGDVLDDIVDNLRVVDKTMANIPDVATFQTAVPNTATEIVFAYYGGVDLTAYIKSGSVGKDIDVYAYGTKYAVVSGKTIFAPENSAELFKGYTALASLDFSNFDTANATSFASMFDGCSGLTSLDVSNFDTSKATTFASMFDGCAALATITASDWSATVTSGNMFNGCTSLVGGNGTTYDADHTDAAYAHIDTADNPGYFTAPA